MIRISFVPLSSGFHYTIDVVLVCLQGTSSIRPVEYYGSFVADCTNLTSLGSHG